MNEAAYRAAEAELWAWVGERPTERSVDLRRTGVRVRIQEVGAGPSVLFLHGANTSGASWATLAARLGGYRCLLVDRPGTGLSERLSDPLTAARFLRLGDELLVDLLDGLAIERAHVVATSLGGFMALRGAAAAPDRVGRMVQFSWPTGGPTSHVPLSMRLTALPGLAVLASAMPATERTVRSIFRSVGHGPSLAAGRISGHDIATYLALLRWTDTLRNELALGAVAVSPLRGLNRDLLPAALLASIRTPTKFIWGAGDAFGGPDIARQVTASIPGAELEIIAGAGHAPWLDDLERCAASTAEFLGRD